MEYDSTNRGSLFKNEKKTEDRHPDMSGSINIEGVDYWISSWTKVSKAGTKFLSLSVRPKQEQSKPAPKAPAKPAKPDLDDDIPW